MLFAEADAALDEAKRINAKDYQDYALKPILGAPPDRFVMDVDALQGLYDLGAQPYPGQRLEREGSLSGVLTNSGPTSTGARQTHPASALPQPALTGFTRSTPSHSS